MSSQHTFKELHIAAEAVIKETEMEKVNWRLIRDITHGLCKACPIQLEHGANQ